MSFESDDFNKADDSKVRIMIEFEGMGYDHGENHLRTVCLTETASGRSDDNAISNEHTNHDEPKTPETNGSSQQVVIDGLQ